jgi:hypothetical protein
MKHQSHTFLVTVSKGVGVVIQSYMLLMNEAIVLDLSFMNLSKKNECIFKFEKYHLSAVDEFRKIIMIFSLIAFPYHQTGLSHVKYHSVTPTKIFLG